MWYQLNLEKEPMSTCLSSPVTQEYTEQEIYLAHSPRKAQDSEHDCGAGAIRHKLHERQREHELQAQINSDYTKATKMQVYAKANTHSMIYLKEKKHHEYIMNQLKSIALTTEQWQVFKEQACWMHILPSHNTCRKEESTPTRPKTISKLRTGQKHVPSSSFQYTIGRNRE